jgi:NADH-quinone oxidoreductase subunit H
MLIRWTIPRFRFDQLMRLAWKGLVPMTMVIAGWQGLLIYTGWPQWTALPVNLLVLVIAGYLGIVSGKAVTGRQMSLPKAEWA